MVGIKDFIKGQTAYLYIVPQYHNQNPRIEEIIVDSVGRKYVTVKRVAWTIKFEESEFLKYGLTEKTDFSANYYLFNTMQKYRDWEEAKRLSRLLKRKFEYCGVIAPYPLNALRTVYQILETAELNNK